jgi:hypothetical protein
VIPSLDGLAPFQIAFVARNLDRFAGELDARLSAGPWRGWVFGPQGQSREYRGGADCDGAAVYYDTANTLGVLVEAVEPPAQMPPTDFIL